MPNWSGIICRFVYGGHLWFSHSEAGDVYLRIATHPPIAFLPRIVFCRRCRLASIPCPCFFCNSAVPSLHGQIRTNLRDIPIPTWEWWPEESFHQFQEQQREAITAFKEMVETILEQTKALKPNA